MGVRAKSLRGSPYFEIQAPRARGSFRGEGKGVLEGWHGVHVLLAVDNVRVEHD